MLPVSSYEADLTGKNEKGKFMLLKKYRTSVAEKNYAANQKNTEPKDFINGQSAYSAYHFGLSTMDKVGCGIIAVYNALRLLGEPVKFADLIREFETNSTETISFGFFGINPFAMKKYFQMHSIPYSKLRSIEELEKTKESGGIYILTFWNDAKKLTQGAHTVALCYREGKFTVYNRTNRGIQAAECSTAAEIVGNGRLIRGYQLYEAFDIEREEWI